MISDIDLGILGNVPFVICVYLVSDKSCIKIKTVRVLFLEAKIILCLLELVFPVDSFTVCISARFIFEWTRPFLMQFKNGMTIWMAAATKATVRNVLAPVSEWEAKKYERQRKREGEWERASEIPFSRKRWFFFCFSRLAQYFYRYIFSFNDIRRYISIYLARSIDTLQTHKHAHRHIHARATRCWRTCVDM